MAKMQAVKKYVGSDPKSFIGHQLDGIRGTMGICESDYADGDFPHLAFAIDALAGYSRNIIEACREIGDLGYYESDLRYNVTDKSTNKSQKATKMAKQEVKKSVWNTWTSSEDNLQEALEKADRAYKQWYDSEIPSNDEESRLYNEIESDIDDLVGKIYEYCRVLNGLIDGGKSASTKKSKYDRLHKALNKLGNFTKEDDEEEESEEDSKEEETEVESEDDDGEEEAEVIVDEESEESEKGCKSKKSLRTSKKKVKMRKAEEMPEDADDQQDINQKGSGNAGSELPEDADDVKEVNEKGSGNAGSELPEDADDTQDQKQARARKQLMRSRNKGMKKFSVTAGGSPNQESYAQRYSQAPMVREAINRHFGDSANKSFDEVQMLQDRIDAMNKSRRNTESNNVPMKLRKR